MEYESKPVSLKDVTLTSFQKWVLFYFIKYPDGTSSAEELIDNMCLTAVLDLDIDNAEEGLIQLADLELINYNSGADRVQQILHNTDGTYRSKKVSKHENMKIGYMGTLKGRLYVKQRIIAPLVIAKQKNQMKQLVAYLRNKTEDGLALELAGILEEQDQHQFLVKLADCAVKQIVPLLNIFKELQERLYGNP